VGNFSLLIVVIFALLAVMLLFWSGRLRESSGLPDGEIVYSDRETWQEVPKPLLDDDLGLVGKPDYLVRTAEGEIVPVELKSSRAPAEPREGHMMQLAVYCALVEYNYGVRPSHGIIQYADKSFAVDYTDELEEDLLDLIADMRQDLYAGDVGRSHENGRRCAACGVREVCDQRLA